MESRTPLAACIVGAGPYGLAIAAHLQSLGIEFRIFGSPMRSWLTKMPKQMFLKSEGCASNLPDPMCRHTLAGYCKNESLPYSDYGTPVSRETFASYAISFQRKLVPNVENVMVVSVKVLGDGFELRLSNGDKLEASKVIVATGMENMAFIPEQIDRLPTEFRSHSAQHYDLSHFKGKEIVVIGGGQSALETAAILKEEGASVSLLVREPKLAWNSPPIMVHRSTYERWLRPRSRLGDGRGLWVYDNLPWIFHYMPQRIRLAKVKAALGPAGAWWLKDRVVGRLPILLGHHINGAEVQGERVALRVTDQSGRRSQLRADHVIAATGYRFNIQNLTFLDEAIKSRLAREEQSPLLSSNFESSISGLHFTGLGSANSFGPVMRFIAGTEYTARRISRHFAGGRAVSFV